MTDRGAPLARFLEFDPGKLRFTGREWRYPLSADNHAISELATLPDGGFLVIERDGLAGAAARFKRIFAIRPDFAQANNCCATVLEKLAKVDLLRISDPKRLASNEGVVRFSYLTPEAVHAIDATHLLIVNDNNFPASGGRLQMTEPDPTEWLWLRIAQ